MRLLLEISLTTSLHQLLMEISIELELLILASRILLLLRLLLMHVVVHTAKVLVSLSELWMITLMTRAILVHSHHALVLLIHHFVLIHVVMEVVVVANVSCSINQIWILKKIHLRIDWNVLLVIDLTNVVVDIHLIHSADVHWVYILHHVADLIVAIS